MADAALAALPPVSTDVVRLAIADLIIYAVLFPPTIWIAWKHGKVGMVTWPLFITFLILRFLADIYQIVKRDDPLIPDAIVLLTIAGSIICLTKTIIGMIYEANVILPCPPKRWTEKIILGVTNISNTAAIALAFYGGSPSKEKQGATNPVLEKIGNCAMLFLLLFLCGWAYTSYRRVQNAAPHPNCRPARFMLLAAAGGLPFQLIRISYTTTYAFYKAPSLDPVMGSFATKLVLIFGTQLGVALCMLAGGWLGKNKKPKDAFGGMELGYVDSEYNDLMASRSNDPK